MNYIDLKSLSSNNGRVDWVMSVGLELDFVYNGNSGKIKVVEYDKKTEKIKYTFENKEYTQPASCFKKAKFGKLFGLGEYLYSVGEIVKTKSGAVKILNHTTIIYGKNKTYKAYEYMCQIDGNTDVISESNLSQGKGCNVCTNNKAMTGVNDIATTHSHLVKYFANEKDAYTHTYGSNDYTIIQCPDCGCTKKVMISYLHNSTFRCYKCGDGVSYPNKFMFNMLNQLNIEFEPEYCPEWVNYRRYDFYVPSKNLIIEMNGGWHYKDNNLSGVSMEKSRDIDIKKDKAAINHGICVIRIDCKTSSMDYIRNNIMKSDLITTFDLRDVDWNACHESAINSRVKEACDLWNGGMYNTYDIASAMNISPSGVWIYLKSGAECGICEYTREKATYYRVERSRLNQAHRRKSIMCVETGDVFAYAKEIEDKSLEMFGVKLLQSNVRAVCNGDRTNHKGYTFKYV